MADYIAAQDVYDLFGEDAVDNWTGADDALLDRQMIRGEAYVTSKFLGSIYRVPMSGVSMVEVKRWMATASAYFCFQKDGRFDTSDRVYEAFQDVKAEIAAAIGGAVTLNLARVSSSRRGPKVVRR